MHTLDKIISKNSTYVCSYLYYMILPSYRIRFMRIEFEFYILNKIAIGKIADPATLGWVF